MYLHLMRHLHLHWLVHESVQNMLGVCWLELTLVTSQVLVVPLHVAPLPLKAEQVL